MILKGLNEGNYDFTWLGLLILLVALCLAIIILLIGSKIKGKKPKTTKILQIIAVVYTIIGIGSCGIILYELK
jgi:predicted permease